MFGSLSTVSPGQWAMLIAAALLIGINKTAIPGVGILPVVMLASVFEERLSTGLQLGMLAVTDIMAVIYFRRHADWKILVRLLPWALVGLIVGECILKLIPPNDTRATRILIGSLVLFLLILGEVKARLRPEAIPTGGFFAAFFGILMGTTTQIANAAGPVSAIYFLSMKLPKEKYMGTTAWCFLILNWIKVPIFAAGGRITAQSLLLDLCMLPVLVLGAALGILIFKKMNQKVFELAVKILAAAASVKLLIGRTT